MDINNTIYTNILGQQEPRKASDIWAIMSTHYLIKSLGHHDERDFVFQLTPRGLLCLKCLTGVCTSPQTQSHQFEKILGAIKKGCEKTKCESDQTIDTKTLLISTAGYKFVKTHYPYLADNDGRLMKIFYQNLPSGNYNAGKTTWKNIETSLCDNSTQSPEL